MCLGTLALGRMYVQECNFFPYTIVRNGAKETTPMSKNATTQKLAVFSKVKVIFGWYTQEKVYVQIADLQGKRVMSKPIIYKPPKHDVTGEGGILLISSKDPMRQGRRAVCPRGKTNEL